MRKLLASLFAVEIVNEHDVATITGGAKPLSHALAALKPALEKQEDTPKTLFETADGWILAGERAAVLMGDDGSLMAKTLPKADEEMGMTSAAKVHLQKLKAALDKGDVDEAKELLKKAMLNINIATGKKVGTKMEGLSLTTVMNAVASQLKPDAGIKVIGEAVEAAKLALIAKLAVAGKTQVMAESLNEMDIAAPYSYNNEAVKTGGCTIDCYGPSVRFSVGDLITKAPNWSIAEFVVESALKKVLVSDAGTAFINAVKAELKGSDKVEPLEITLKESTDEEEITEVESFAQVMVGEGKLELRAGKDGDGEVLLTVECDTKDDAAVTAALDKLNAEATELGYVFVEGKPKDDDEEDDEEEEDEEEEEEDEEEDDVEEALKRIQDKATDLVIEHSVDFGTAIVALDRAVTNRDVASALAAVELMAEAAGVTLEEGFATKKRAPGRKPSGKTFVKKATTGKSIPAPRLPVDVGPGAKAGGSTGGQADAGTKGGTRKEQGNPASKPDKVAPPDVPAAVKESTRHGGMKNWRPGKLASTPTDPPAGGKDQAIDFSDADAVNEWIETVQKMSVDEFMESFVGYVSEDDAETFTARLTALTEAYKTKPGKKDMARKLTAANPLIKKKTGKGLDLESVQVAASKEFAVVEFAPSGRDAFFAAAKAAGVPDDSNAYVTEGRLCVEVPKTCVRKLTAVLGTEDFKFSA